MSIALVDSKIYNEWDIYHYPGKDKALEVLDNFTKAFRMAFGAKEWNVSEWQYKEHSTTTKIFMIIWCILLAPISLIILIVVAVKMIVSSTIKLKPRITIETVIHSNLEKIKKEAGEETQKSLQGIKEWAKKEIYKNVIPSIKRYEADNSENPRICQEFIDDSFSLIDNELKASMNRYYDKEISKLKTLKVFCDTRDSEMLQEYGKTLQIEIEKKEKAKQEAYKIWVEEL